MTNIDNDRKPQGCPIDHAQTIPSTTLPSSRSSWNPSTWFSSTAKPTSTSLAKSVLENSSAGCPVQHEQRPGCPVDHSGSTPVHLPASLEAAARHPQSPHPDQRIPLSTHRVISSIPRADELRDEKTVAPHQPAEESKWVYPSEQQFYNAMRRKGWDGIDESTIPDVVYIHNAVNERGWRDVMRWERELYNNPNPRLVKFLGRPTDMSPRAFFNTYILWYNRPFDRHDWYVDAGDDKEPRRYVIDFYNGDDGSSTGNGYISSVLDRMRGRTEQAPPLRAGLPSMYLDVRPALDSPEALSSRLKMYLIDAFPGIYAAIRPRSPALTQSAPGKEEGEKSIN